MPSLPTGFRDFSVMTRPKVDPQNRQRTVRACEGCKRRKQKVVPRRICPPGSSDTKGRGHQSLTPRRALSATVSVPAVPARSAACCASTAPMTGRPMIPGPGRGACPRARRRRPVEPVPVDLHGHIRHRRTRPAWRLHRQPNGGARASTRPREPPERPCRTTWAGTTTGRPRRRRPRARCRRGAFSRHVGSWKRKRLPRCLGPPRRAEMTRKRSCTRTRACCKTRVAGYVSDPALETGIVT